MANILNNFYFNLPGGHYRKKLENDPNRKRLFETIDRLLETEFTNMDARGLTTSMYNANGMCADALNFGYKTVEELQAAMEEPRRIMNEAQDQMLPLYRRLVELGFDEEMLKR